MDDIVDLIKKISNHTSDAIKVCMPAKIETYDFKTQKASVKIDMKELYSDDKEVDYPVISGVPVVFPASGGASITMPVNRGDTCLVIFADRDIGNWLLGGSGQKPDTMRMHTLTDAIAIMGLNPFTKASEVENNTDLLINYSGSKVKLRPEGFIEISSGIEVTIATKTITINCDNANVNINENAIIQCDTASITVNEDAELFCTNATIVASEVLTLESNSTIITTNENLTLDCKVATITTTNTITIDCADAVITASGDITTESTNFLHTGNMKITGNMEITGTSKISGALTTQAGITNTGGTTTSNGKVLETHTHSYNAPVVGSTPTAAIPAVTGTPI